MDFSYFARQMMQGQQPPARTPGSPFPLQLTDLWSSSAEPDYPEPPTYINDPSELPDEEQKRLRRDNILKALAAAFGAQPGYMGSTALAAVADRGKNEQQALERYNSVRQNQFSAERQRAALQAETMRTRAMTQKEGQQAKSVIGKAQHLWELAADDPNFQGRIVSAAQRGPDAMEELSKLEASMPGRKALRKAGVDPDDPMAVTAAKEKAEAALKEEQERKRREAEETQKREHEKWLASQNLGAYKPVERAPREGTTFVAPDGKAYLVDQATGNIISEIKIPGGVRDSRVGLDPWTESLRQAQAQARALTGIPNGLSVQQYARQLYEIRMAGPNGPEVGVPKVGGDRAPRGTPPPKAGGNARLIPGAKAGQSGADFSGVSDPKARSWAQKQLAAGTPRATIEAQLRKWGAL